jgi:flagellar assembly protein FliH
MSSLSAIAGRIDNEGFRQDSRFALALPGQRPMSEEPAAEVADPVATAFAEGYAAGLEQARAEAEATIAAEAEARPALDIAFMRFDAEMAETLRQRLTETVLALCDATLVPFAVDPEKLAQRVERAVAMLARADDERVIRLNPDDIKLVSPRLPKDWHIVEDRSLPRGSLRVETQSGGVEDGPAQWRHALAEALESC